MVGLGFFLLVLNKATDLEILLLSLCSFLNKKNIRRSEAQVHEYTLMSMLREAFEKLI